MRFSPHLVILTLLQPIVYVGLDPYNVLVTDAVTFYKTNFIVEFSVLALHV